MEEADTVEMWNTFDKWGFKKDYLDIACIIYKTDAYWWV